MKAQILFSAIAALVAGSVGGYLAAGLGSTHESSVASNDPSVVDLRSELSTLKSINEDLLQRVKMLEQSPVVTASPQREEVAAKAPAADLTPELRQLAESLREPNKVPDGLRQQVETVIADVKAKEEQKREEDRKKRDAERFEQRFTQIAKDLNLNAFQQTEMRKTLTDEQAKRDAMRDQMQNNNGNPPDFASMKSQWDTLRTETKNDLARYLTNEQITKYEESYGNPFGGGGRGGRGGGGGGPGGFGGGFGNNGQGGGAAKPGTGGSQKQPGGN